MKKVAILLLAACALLTGCSPATSDDFISAAQSRNYDVHQDAVAEDTWQAVKNGCVVVFYEKETSAEAFELYEEGLEEKLLVARSIGAKMQSESNVPGYHNFSIKTAARMVYGTQFQNTFLYLNGRRDCEKDFEPLLETLGLPY